MLLLIPFLAGAGTTGYFWYNQKQENKPTVQDELYAVLLPIFIILVGLLFLRWLHAKGTIPKTKKS